MTAKKKVVITMIEPRNRLAVISSARKAAFKILLAVERGQSHSDDLLRERAVNVLSSPDRNLATALVLGVLRWQIQLDHQIHALLSRPNAKLDPEILIAMRLGAFQLLHLDRIPARAVLSESVELAKQSGHRFAAGLVNAVLRKLAKSLQPAEKAQGDALQAAENKMILEDFDEDHRSGPKGPVDYAEVAARLKSCPVTKQLSETNSTGFSAAGSGAEEKLPEESIAELALAQAHPAWLVERWVDFYGLEATRKLCRHGQSQPLLAVRLVSPDVEAELTQAGIVLEAGEVLSAARTVVAGDVTATEAFREGRVRLQDEGSQLVAEIASKNPDQKVKSILDACAAPGGKTLILAERNSTAHIVAFEASASRLAQLRKRLAFLGDRVECRQADAATLAEDAVFDLALADVPCSGTGTLGRNPEIRHRLRPEDLPRQAERQKAILAAALRVLRPGGRVVYSTCSLEPEENEQVIAAVLAATPKARMVSLGDRIGELLCEGILTPEGVERLRGALTPDGNLRLLPGVFRTDGFFIAMIERTA
jgi:16S rRNA (cytosine967-C5)-methyltransferase